MTPLCTVGHLLDTVLTATAWEHVPSAVEHGSGCDVLVAGLFPTDEQLPPRRCLPFRAWRV
jgi:hypothetical protein